MSLEVKRQADFYEEEASAEEQILHQLKNIAGFLFVIIVLLVIGISALL